MKKFLCTFLALVLLLPLALSFTVNANSTEELTYSKSKDFELRVGENELKPAFDSNAWYYSNARLCYDKGLFTCPFALSNKYLWEMPRPVLERDILIAAIKLIYSYQGKTLPEYFPTNSAYYLDGIGEFDKTNVFSKEVLDAAIHQRELKYNIKFRDSNWAPTRNKEINTIQKIVEELQLNKLPDGIEEEYLVGSLSAPVLANKKSLLIILSNLLRIIDPGEEINSISGVENIPSDSPYAKDVLRLFNLGLYTSSGNGRYEMYDTVTYPEFVTIFARILDPNLRIKISQEDYNNMLKSTTVTTYNSISLDYALDYMNTGLSDSYRWMDKFDSKEFNANDLVYCDEAQKVAYAVSNTSIVPNELRQLKYYENISSVNPAAKYNFKEFFDLTHTLTNKVEAATYIVQLIECRANLFQPFHITQTLKPELRGNFSDKEIHYIEKALSIGLLENTKEDIFATTLTKGEFIKMLTFFSLKYNTNLVENIGRLDKERYSIVTDPALLPKNANAYPYVLNNAPKEVYEILEIPNHSFYDIDIDNGIVYYYENGEILSAPHSEMNGWTTGCETPTHFYNKNRFARYKGVIEYFCDLLINVDYRHLDEFKTSINSAIATYHQYIAVTSDAEKEVFYQELEAYMNYVKENEIILEGDSECILPIVYSWYYFSGNPLLQACAYVRTHIQFKVVHSKTNKNLLLSDSSIGVTYEGEAFDFYSDVMTYDNNYDHYAVYPRSPITKEIVYGGENVTTN